MDAKLSDLVAVNVRTGTGLTVDHGESCFVQEPEPPVFEQPYGQNGERQQHYEYEQVGTVLSVALLSHPLSCDVVHRVALALAPDEQQCQQKRQQEKQSGRFNIERASHCKSHCVCLKQVMCRWVRLACDGNCSEKDTENE